MAINKRDALQAMDFGSDVAEHEINELSSYFVETDQWKKIAGGKIDVVYGAKGSGKSAIYYLLESKTDDFFDSKILLATAENLQSDPAFSEIKHDAPPTEDEFVGLWKLYLCSVAALKAKDIGVCNSDLDDVLDVMGDWLDISPGISLNSILKMAADYVRHFFRPKAIEGTLNLDPASGTPTGITGRIVFSEPSRIERARGKVPIREVLIKLNTAMAASGYSLWLLLDRLDVAFASSSELEARALRALFRTYNDVYALSNIKLKIFMRSDIWTRITDKGFREATHAASPQKSVILKWDHSSLFSVFIKRLLNSDEFCRLYGLNKVEILADVALQEDLIGKIFPEKVKAGNNPKTFKWVVGRITDGKGSAAPRELIQFMSSLRNTQLKKYETGGGAQSGDILFERPSFKEALPDVSDARLQRTIFAEYEKLKPRIEALRGHKSKHSPETLGKIWGIGQKDAEDIALDLHEVGFLEKIESKNRTIFRVPFLYMPALGITQGAEEGLSDEDSSVAVEGDDDDDAP